MRHASYLTPVGMRHASQNAGDGVSRNILARATSLVAERVVQVGWRIDNGGRWPAPALAARIAPEVLYGGAACYTKAPVYE